MNKTYKEDPIMKTLLSAIFESVLLAGTAFCQEGRTFDADLEITRQHIRFPV